MGAVRSARVQYAREILQRELLPHLGISDYCETKKVRVERKNCVEGLSNVWEPLKLISRMATMSRLAKESWLHVSASFTDSVHIIEYTPSSYRHPLRCNARFTLGVFGAYFVAQISPQALEPKR